MSKWYAKTSAGGHQGLVIDEATGRTVAVTYDPKDALKVAAVNDLLEVCQSTLEALQSMTTQEFAAGADRPLRIKLQAAIHKAERGE